MKVLTKTDLLASNVGCLFLASKELRSYLLSQGFRQAELLELVALPKEARNEERTLPKGFAFKDGTILARDTPLQVLIPATPLELKFYQGKASAKAVNQVRVHLIARLSQEEINVLLPNEPLKGQAPSKEETQALQEFAILDDLGIFS